MVTPHGLQGGREDQEVGAVSGYLLKLARGSIEGTSTFASTLRGLREYIREMIILGDDLPDDAVVQTEVEYRVDDPVMQ